MTDTATVDDLGKRLKENQAEIALHTAKIDMLYAILDLALEKLYQIKCQCTGFSSATCLRCQAIHDLVAAKEQT